MSWPTTKLSLLTQAGGRKVAADQEEVPPAVAEVYSTVSSTWAWWTDGNHIVNYLATLHSENIRSH